MNKKKLVALSAGTLLALAGGFTAGAAFAGVLPLQAPAGLKAADGQNVEQMQKPNYPINAKGLTFGSAADAPSSDAEPDLIKVLATNGKEGYAYKSDLAAATGDTAMASFKSPEDAIKWQQAHQGKATAVKVYDVDGVSVIGEFVVLPSQATTIK